MGFSIRDRFVLGVLLYLSLNDTANSSAIRNSDYVIKVTSECPLFPNGSARVHVLTDIPDSTPFAICDGAKSHDLERSSLGEWTGDVLFQSNNVSTTCVFYREENSQTYSINVFVPFSSGLIMGPMKPYVITCTYDDQLEEGSNESIFVLGNKPVMGILNNAGQISKSNVELYVIDVVGNILTDTLEIGHSVQLVAFLRGEFPEEVSFQTMSCRAIGSSYTYDLITGGCGDGTIFNKAQGFTTFGKIAISPYFRSFRFPASKSLKFDCAFVICRENCDGNSCTMPA